MSTTTKSVNLPVSLIEDIEEMIRQSGGIWVSRDEFVREAVRLHLDRNRDKIRER